MLTERAESHQRQFHFVQRLCGHTHTHKVVNFVHKQGEKMVALAAAAAAEPVKLISSIIM